MHSIPGAGAAPIFQNFRPPPGLDSPSGNASLEGVPDDVPTGITPLLAEVHVTLNGEILAKYAIEPGEYIIGRDATCHIVVEADQVSRHHARLTFNSFEVLIEDLGSSNGVFIEGVQVQIPTRLRAEQEVQIGSARLHVWLNPHTEQRFRAALWDNDLGLESVRKMLGGPKYKIVTTIARGGMGIIMQARDLRIRRTVAMKVMKTAAQFSRENVLRFIDEAQVTGQLEHPNIVPVYELGMDEQGETFYTMKFVRGTTLDEVLRGLRNGNEKTIRRYTLGTLLTIFQKICDGVAYAHAKGVVHRDLKPENVMIGAYGEVLVMDWGLAKNLTGAQRQDGGAPPIETVVDPFVTDARGFQTLNGLVVGTPPYISPEQARGELGRIDARSDIFVLGEILYAILTLRVPVDGSTVAEVIDNILSSRITPPISYSSPPKSGRNLKPEADPDHFPLPHLPAGKVPESLSAVVMKAMALDPEKRYQAVEEMQADITSFQGGFATKAERATLAKQIFLWAARHKGEVTLISIFTVLMFVALSMFFVSLKRERDAAVRNYQLAIANEARANEKEKLAERVLEDLRQTAPTFASDAQALIEDQRLDEALLKIDYAIAQQPQNAEFWSLKGNVLQSMLRLSEAAAAYETALGFDPGQTVALQNLEISKRIAAIVPDGEKPNPAQLRELQQTLLEQNRVDEAYAMLRQLTTDRDLFRRTTLDAFGRLGLRERVETNDDQTINLDLSGMDLGRGFQSPPQRGGPPRRGAPPSLRDLRNRPIVSLNLDGTRIPDLTPIKGWKLERLSTSNNPITDLAPLAGMMLRALGADGCQISDLAPLTGMPLESLRLRNSRIQSLEPLRGAPIENLVLAGCREVRDLAPLEGMPLQQLDLSRTSVADLSPLVGSPIRELNLEGCAEIQSLDILSQLLHLEAVVLPRHIREISFLRDHPTLRRVSYKKLTEPAREFWAAFDREKASAR